MFPPALLLRHLSEGREGETAALPIDCYLNGQSLASLFDRVLTPAMHQVGDLWCRGARDYAHVRRAADKLHCAIALGGNGLADRLMRQRFPSELYGKNFEQLLVFARLLVSAARS